MSSIRECVREIKENKFPESKHEFHMLEEEVKLLKEKCL